jgi:hypothetical protein
VLRSVIVVGGLLLLLFRPTLTVPRVAASAATTVASASLGIYLTHFGVLPLATLGFPAPVVVAVAIAVGIGTTWVVEWLWRRVALWRRQRATNARVEVGVAAVHRSDVALEDPGRRGSDHLIAA